MIGASTPSKFSPTPYPKLQPFLHPRPSWAAAARPAYGTRPSDSIVNHTSTAIWDSGILDVVSLSVTMASMLPEMYSPWFSLPSNCIAPTNPLCIIKVRPDSGDAPCRCQSLLAVQLLPTSTAPPRFCASSRTTAEWIRRASVSPQSEPALGTRV
eukprot:3441538-Rhodomonas_salina.2